MLQYSYRLVDVFTNQPFAGNQLAVFPDAQGLSVEVMQRIANELKLSETSFVLPAESDDHDFRVRIFTPEKEMPMAGHPTIGTAYVLAELGLIPTENTTQVCRFLEGVGVIEVEVASRNGSPQFVQMRQPLPQFGDILNDREAIADLLSLHIDDLDPRYPIQIVSTGVPFTYVPVKNLDAMKQIRIRADHGEQHKQKHNASIFAFTTETIHETSDVHSRMFGLTMGIPEDPATGAASGPLGAYLVQHRVFGDQTRFTSEQGLEMNRPSFIQIDIGYSNNQFTHVIISGQCMMIGEGTINLQENESHATTP